MNSIAQAVPEAALQAIRKLIKEQGFGPGDALPSQRDLALQLGVSRASLREALSSLSALGVVSVQPGKGVFVQEAQEPPGFAWPFAAQATPLDIFQLRYALEGFAAGLAAVTLSIDELDSLEENVEAMRKVLKAGDFEAGRAAGLRIPPAHPPRQRQPGDGQHPECQRRGVPGEPEVTVHPAGAGHGNLAGAPQSLARPGPARERGGAENHAGTCT